MESKRKGSRKTRLDWRRNIDVTDIQEGLEAKTTHEILHGDEELFYIDELSETAQTPKVSSLDILRNKSKVAPLPLRVRKKVSEKAKSKLMALAGRLYAVSETKAKVILDGILRGRSKDVWSEEPDEVTFTPLLPDEQPPEAHKVIAPSPVEKAAIPELHAGKSYNPSLDLWQELLKMEVEPELSREQKRLAVLEHQKRIQHLVETLKDDEIEVDVDVETVEDEALRFKLSVNPPTETVYRPRNVRNALAREKAQKLLKAKHEELQAQLCDLDRVAEIAREIDEKRRLKKKAKKTARYTSHGRGELAPQGVEVKLLSELTSSLKNLKPEGNGLYDQMYRLQSTGQIETVRK